MRAGSGDRDAIRTKIAQTPNALIVVAGPNGAGKSTFVETFLLPLELPVVNPDAIALALFPDAPTDPYEAARAADLVRVDLVERGVSFLMETVFSDAKGAKLAFLRDAQKRGFVIILVFIGLESRELSRARVIQRVEAGGHDVPDEKIDVRFDRTLKNLAEAMTFVDHAFVFDNSSADTPYRFVAEARAAKVVRRGTHVPMWWRSLHL